MIANDVFTGCFGIVASDDTDAVVKVAVGAVRSGFAVVVNKPGQKIPVCTLAARAAKAADTDAQNTAKEAGDPHWSRRRHQCGLYHALTDDKTARTVVTRMVKTYGQVNLGVELGRSRMVVVDVDTAQEKAAFLAAWHAATGEDTGELSPTVLSPGAVTTDEHGVQTWVHKDGGHFWFTLPEGVELPTDTGVLKGDGGWAVMWHGKQVLVPPSSRSEGVYRLVGQSSPLPAWLEEFIRSGAALVTEKRARAVVSASAGGPIDAWSATVPWDDLLGPDGWNDTGKADRCGCPVWSAPGDHASPKSATAHDVGCDTFDTAQGSAPLHIWTDNPPPEVADAVRATGSRSLTKLRYVAWTRHGGDMGGALRSLGVESSVPAAYSADDLFAAADAAVAASAGDPGPEDHPGPERAPGPSLRVATLLPDEFWTSRPELAQIRQAAHSRSMPGDPVFHGVLARLASMLPGTLQCETGILSPASLNYFAALVAPSGIGKSSSSHLAAELLPVPPQLLAAGRYLERLPLGSGEGLAEAFMGTREESTGETYQGGARRGEDKTKSVRAQVRCNVLFYVDEGASLTKLMAERTGSTLGQMVRTAWTGDTLGQANGTAERTRIVRRYSLGMVVGFQPSTALPLLDGVDEGTPQRFVWSRIAGPGMPDQPPDWTGPLYLDPEVYGGDPFADQEDRAELRGPLTLAASLRDLVRREHLAKLRGEDTDCGGFNSHKPLTLVKIASLLAVLARRWDVNEEDWQLAQVVWSTSGAIRLALTEAREREAATAAAQRKAAAVDQARAIHEATGGFDPAVERVARTLVRKIGRKGPMKQGYLAREVAARDRQWVSDALEYAIGQEWLVGGGEEDVSVGPDNPS